MKFVSRTEELNILKREYGKKSSSFVAVYGRRRIGKTELIDHFLKSTNCFTFSVTGAYDSTQKSHLANFANKLSLAFGVEEHEFKDWDEAFKVLREQIEKIKLPRGCKFSIFIDELPWLAEMKNRGFKGAFRSYFVQCLKRVGGFRIFSTTDKIWAAKTRHTLQFE